MKPLLLFIILAYLTTSCTPSPSDRSDTIISMQTIDRQGFAETMSNKERLKPFQTTDFIAPQPYQKVLRVYGKNLEGQSLSKITSYHTNGHIWQYLDVVDGRAHGYYREWHPSGQLKIEAPVIEGVADINDLAQSSWIFDGSCLIFDDEGNLIANIPYSKGLLHGISEYYFESGALQKIIPYSKGLVHGNLQLFDEKGECLEHIPYSFDEKHGNAYAIWEPNHLLYDEEYELGILLNASYYNSHGDCVARIKDKEGHQAQFKNGFLHSLMTYQKGIPEGELQIFHPNGTLYRSFFVFQDKKEGEELEYYPTQPGEPLVPKLCLHWHEDKIQGQVKTWYANGQIESQKDVSNNKKQGLSFAWFKNGDLMLIEEYEFDRLVKGSYYKKGDKKAVSKIESGKGTATMYSSDGIFLRKIPYEKGRPLLSEDSLR